MDKRIFHLKGRLSQDLGRDWTVEDMAAAANVTVPYFHRLFRDEHDGITPAAFLHNLRLEQAAAMLSDPECFLQIDQIAVAVGFKNQSHFSRDFKTKYGTTPTKFQKTQAEIHQSTAPEGSDEQK